MKDKKQSTKHLVEEPFALYEIYQDTTQAGN